MIKNIIISLLLFLLQFSSCFQLDNHFCHNPLQIIKNTLIEIQQQNKAGDYSLAFSTTNFLYLYISTIEQQCNIGFKDFIKLEQNLTCPNLLQNFDKNIQSIQFDTSDENIISIIQENKNTIILLNQFCTNSEFKQKNLRASGGGTGCAACTVIMSVINNYLKISTTKIDEFLEKEFCKWFPKDLQATCVTTIKIFGPIIIDGFVNEYNADFVCHEAKICTDPKCRIVKSIKDDYNLRKINIEEIQSLNLKESPWQWLIDLIKRFAENHDPLVDIDGDKFSNIPTFRGSDWRGFDCNENNKDIYPGRKIYSGFNKGEDYNCNGISGINPLSNKPYKEELCKDSGQIGVAVAGDSAGAHFSLPEQWLNVSLFNGTQYHNLLYVASNELDFPHKGGYTGKLPNDDFNPLQSVYKKLVERNRCNYNDYQNIAVNGGDSENTYGTIKALARDKVNDYPLLMFLELVGNDVCNHKSLEGQTKPDVFKRNIMKLLQYLDSVLPKGSHVFLFGMVDGRILWDTLNSRIHPLNVTYRNVYDLLNCLQISPCWGWLNSNETVRNISSEHAASLNQVYRDIKKEGTQFLNFDFDYYDFPAQEIFDWFVQKGGDPFQLIEHSDGFHPNQRFNAYLADWIWNKLLTDHPSWIGKVNENNEKIEMIINKNFQQKIEKIEIQ